MSPDLHTVLTTEERALLEKLREVPSGALRTSLVALLTDLVAFACQPSCAAAQADGVPCDSAHSTCDRCREAVAVLDEIDSTLAGILGLRQRRRASVPEGRPA